MIMENEGFEGKKRRGRQKVLNKAAKIVLKKARYKIEDSTKKLTHIVSKPNKRVMKRCLKCLKLEAPETAKKTSAYCLPPLPNPTLF